MFAQGRRWTLTINGKMSLYNGQQEKPQIHPLWSDRNMIKANLFKLRELLYKT